MTRQAPQSRRRGRDFEQAVHRFVAALDPRTEVLFDHSVPDVHTGTPRQVDVWVNAKVMGHFPMSILISCKDYKRPLNISHIGAFHSEVRDTGANTGVIFSRSGFYRPAVEKAKALRLPCCRLYQDERADMPAVLFLTSYLCYPQVQLVVIGHQRAAVRTWDELFDFRVRSDAGEIEALEAIEQVFHAGQNRTLKQWDPNSGFPPDWEDELDLASGLHVIVRGGWRKFVGRVEGHYVNGSYCFNDGGFVGTQATPVIDRFNLPGPGWEDITENPTTSGRTKVFAIIHSPNVQALLRQQLTGKAAE